MSIFKELIVIDDDDDTVSDGKDVVELNVPFLKVEVRMDGPVRSPQELGISNWSFKPSDSPPRRPSTPSSPPTKRQRVERELRNDGSMSIEALESTGGAISSLTDDDSYHFMPPESITIDDEKLEADGISTEQKNRVRRSSEGRVVIDVDEIAEALEDLMFLGVNAQEPQIQGEWVRRSRQSTVIPPRNVPVNYPFLLWAEDIKSRNGEILRPGKTAEVQFPMELRKDAIFLYITSIIKNMVTGDFTLRGHQLLRSRDLNGILSKKCNELIWNIEVDLDDQRTDLEQSLSEVPLDGIIGTREVRFTNQIYPNCSFRNEHHDYCSQEELDNFAPLVVRWKFIRKYSTAKDRHNNKVGESYLEYLRDKDVMAFCPYLAVNDLERRDQYRGPTLLGGSHIPGEETQQESIKIIDLDEENPNRKESIDLTGKIPSRQFGRLSLEENVVRESNDPAYFTMKKPVVGSIDLTNGNSGSVHGEQRAASHAPKPRTILKAGQKYSYGDSFCGGGGATRGALQAGLEVRWGFDHWAVAHECWTSNFPKAKAFCKSADEVVSYGKTGIFNFKVDVVHLSPPCQFFSSAHTVDGKDDDMNSASLFACGHILDVAKPRVATLEQTFGLASPQFRHFHNALIREFADRGYSIRWKTVAFASWGLPARRFRLIMIASCPGERLPTFPPATHASPDEVDKSNPRLSPWVTVNSVLRLIPVGTPHHKPHLVTHYNPPKPRWDANTILPRCMTTSGGQNYHPDGTRDLTNAEYAALQGFPPIHRFPDTHVKKIIGNAVPPKVATVLFGWIRKWLEEEDGVVREPIVLDD